MTNYLFIESRDPFESRDTAFVVETARALKERGHEVTVFLVQNGVLGTRRDARDSYLTSLLQVGVRLLADDFSLQERGIETAALRPGVRPTSIDAVVTALATEQTKAIWH